MIIENYFAYFHDCSIINVSQVRDNIIIAMESAQIPPEDMNDNNMLSNYSTLKGNLIITGISQIYEGGDKVDEMVASYDGGSILDMEKSANQLLLGVIWRNYTTLPIDKTEVCSYAIEGTDIYWQNIPNYPDKFAQRIDQYDILFSKGKLFDIYRLGNQVYMLVETPAICAGQELEFDLTCDRTLKVELAMEWVTSATIDENEFVKWETLNRPYATILSLSITHHELSMFFLDPVKQKVSLLRIHFGAIDWHGNSGEKCRER